MAALPADTRRFDRALACAIAVVLSAWYFDGLASDEQTHADEVYWTAAGWQATQLFFVERDFDHVFWSSSVARHILARDKKREAAASRNPKLGMLLLGGAMHLGGAPEVQWTQYAFARSTAWNRANGRLPPHATLLAARVPVALLGVAGGVLAFAILRFWLAPGWAFAGALLLAANPLVTLVCRRAMLDGPAYVFSLASFLALLIAVRPESRERFAPAVGLGLALSAAVGCKLNAGVLVPVVVIVFAIEAWRRRSPAPVLRLAVVGLVALVPFVALNPTLYGAPVQGLRDMFRLGGELGDLPLLFPRDALPDFPSRTSAAASILLGEFGMLRSTVGIPGEALFALTGLAAFAWHARGDSAARVLLIWWVVATIAVCTWPSVRWNRYFLPGLAPLVLVEFAGLVIFGRALALRARLARASDGAAA